MKTLVVTAGDQSHGKFLVEKWLPTLRERAEYRGDVLILDYDLSDECARVLSQAEKVFLEKQTVEVGIWVDRHKAIYNCLTGAYARYDIVLCVDGKDVIFQKPIAPLFEEAKDIVCYTVEHRTNQEYARLDDDIIWQVIKDKPIINGGLYIGPIKQIAELEQFIHDQCKHCSVDQLWLNVLIYYYRFPAKRVSDTWNWARSRGVKEVDDVYYTLEGEEVAIFHDH